jgi:hypothetical protein
MYLIWVVCVVMHLNKKKLKFISDILLFRSLNMISKFFEPPVNWLCSNAYGTTHRVLVDREFSMSWEDRPSSIAPMVKNLCSNYCVCYENENLLRHSGSKDTSHVLLITTISLEQLARLSWNFQFLPNYSWSTYCKNISRISDISLNNSPLHRHYGRVSSTGIPS